VKNTLSWLAIFPEIIFGGVHSTQHADVPQKRKQQRKTIRPVRKTEADLDINALGQKHVAPRNQF